MFKRTLFTVFEVFYNIKVPFGHFNALLLNKSITYLKKTNFKTTVYVIFMSYQIQSYCRNPTVD